MSGRGVWGVAALWLGLGVAIAWPASEHVPRWLAAVAADGVEFSAPQRLWWLAAAWLVPLLGLGAVVDLPRWQVALATLLRMAGIAALVIATAGPQLRRDRPRQISVVHLVDQSSSVPPAALADALTAIHADAASQRARAADALDSGEVPTLHVAAFAAHAARLAWPPPVAERPAADGALPALSLPALASGSDATHLEGAIDLAMGLLEPGLDPHVVVWSDGVENRGDVRRALPALRRAGVTVHRGAIDTAAQTAEVLVEGIDVAPRVRANLPTPIAVVVRASIHGRVRCRADGPGVRLGPIEAEIAPGSQRLDLGRARWREAGAHPLTARCEVIRGGDRFASNNAVAARVVVLARPKVLYIEGTLPSARTLARALEDDFDLTVRGVEGMPRSAADLKEFQAVILSDVARVNAAGVPQVGDAEQRALGAWAQAGGGLLFVGGENALGSGGWQDTWLDRHVLPVRMDVESKEEEPSIALMLVMDRSGSMAGPKMELAKEAARATAEALGHEDRIGVVGFDSAPRLVVPLQRAGNRYRIATRIDGMTPAGGTHIYPALQMAFRELDPAQAKVKHVILLSDGQAPRQGIDALVRQMRQSRITVTAVGIGDEIDRGMLESIADRGGGRAYFTDRPENLPRIFVRETKQIAGESVVERRVFARRLAAAGRVDLLRGVDLEAAPALRGYLSTKVKPAAQELLRLSSGEPLLVRWRLGLGKVAVWTSDLKNRWAQDWLDWSGYAVLARQLVRDILQEDLAGEVQPRLQREDDQVRVSVDAVLDDRPAVGLHALARLRPPSGEEVALGLAEVAPGRYEALAAMDSFGAYDVEVELRAAPELPVLLRGRASASRPYPDELLLRPQGPQALDELVAATGGHPAATPTHWRAPSGRTWRSWQPLWPTLVASALGLLLVELLLRRVRLGRARAASWFGSAPAAPQRRRR